MGAPGRYQHMKRPEVTGNQAGYEVDKKERERIWGKGKKDGAEASNGQVKKDLKKPKKYGLHPEGNSEPIIAFI